MPFFILGRLLFHFFSVAIKKRRKNCSELVAESNQPCTTITPVADLETFSDVNWLFIFSMSLMCVHVSPNINEIYDS